MQPPVRQLTDREQELVTILRQRFFLFPRDYWRSIFGGALAFLLAVGFVSWGTAKAALETTVTKQAANEIADLRDQARLHVQALQVDSYIRTGSKIILESERNPGLFLHAHTKKNDNLGEVSDVNARPAAPTSPFVRWTVEKVATGP